MLRTRVLCIPVFLFASFNKYETGSYCYNLIHRRNGRAAEGAPLLREYGVYSLIEGSNPSFSAIFLNIHQCFSGVCLGIWRTKRIWFEPWFDKIAGSNFECAKRSPKGAGQEVRNKKSPGAIFIITFYVMTPKGRGQESPSNPSVQQPEKGKGSHFLVYIQEYGGQRGSGSMRI